MARLKRIALIALGAATIAAAASPRPAPPRQAGGQAAGSGGRGQAVTLPDGPARDFAQAMCATCHPLTMITGSAGYDQQGWKDLIGTMVRLPAAQENAVTEYLAANFPPKPGRRPTLVPGGTKITIKEWIAPTLGQRVRDPLQLADHT